MTDRWRRVGLRSQGQFVWVMLDGRPVLTVTGASVESGFASVALGRTGDPGDEQESAVELRNLRVASVAGGEAARAVTYRQSEPPRLGATMAGSGVAEFVPPIGAPPETGDVVIENLLSMRGTISAEKCPTGLAWAERAPEGIVLRVRGPCTAGASSAAIAVSVPGLSVPDGDIQLEMKAQSGADGLVLTVWPRAGTDIGNAYAVGLRWFPGWSGTYIGKNVDSCYTTLAERTDLAGLVRLDEWTTMAVRMHGPRLWVLLNGRPVLTAEDGTVQTGEVWIRLLRVGDVNDSREVAVAVRNVKITRLTDSAPERIPVYRPPSPAQATVTGMWTAPSP